MEIQTTSTLGSINWSNLWKTINSALHKYSRDTMWESTYAEDYWHLPLRVSPPDELLAEDRALAGGCLEIMDSIENESDADRPERPASEPTFPDELVTALGLFILPEDVWKYSKLARLQHQDRAIHAEANSTAHGHLQSMGKVEGAEDTAGVEGPNERSEDGLDEQRKSEMPSEGEIGKGSQTTSGWVAGGQREDGFGELADGSEQTDVEGSGSDDDEWVTGDEKSVDSGRGGYHDGGSDNMTR